MFQQPRLVRAASASYPIASRRATFFQRQGSSGSGRTGAGAPTAITGWLSITQLSRASPLAG